MMAYVSFGRRVGSKGGSGAGGDPVLFTRVTSVPWLCVWYETLHEAMVCPAGGVMFAVIGTGLVTIDPSAGDGAPIVGGVCAVVPPPFPTMTRMTAEANPLAAVVALTVMA